MINNYVIGIQTFVKLDTLQKLVNSLFRCDGIDKYKIIFFIDSTNNLLYNNRHQWIEKNKQVQEYLKQLSTDKNNIILYSPNNNTGPYLGCQQLIDMCMCHSDYVIFLEDDVILAKDALDYYEKMYDQYLTKPDYSCIDAVCSSTWQQYNTYNIEAIQTNYESFSQRMTSVETMNWLHSYEFAITHKAWERYREVRGTARGDLLVGYEFQRLHKYTIVPSIGRSCRIGYNHSDGFSFYHNQLSQIPNNMCDIPESNHFTHCISTYHLFNKPC